MFKKYTSIENSYRTEILYRIKGHDLWDNLYVVQEKVHGANLSFFTKDGINFSAAKRTEGIKNDEKFYNHQLILEQNVDKFKSIFNSIRTKHKDLNQMSIYGEVIGGSYPHKEVARNNKAIKVQKGIFYSPNNEFYAFDIQLNCESYLNVDNTNELFEQNGLLYAKTLFKGTLDECLKYSNLFPTTITDLLGLPGIEPNYCEGVIIKPVLTSHFNNGNRVILKNKNEKWSENSKHHKSIKQDAPLSDKVVQLQDIIKGYVTENRLNNVISKIGEVTKKDFGLIIADFNRDIIEDFSKDYNEELSVLAKKEQKLVTKSIVQVSSNMIKQYLIK